MSLKITIALLACTTAMACTPVTPTGSGPVLDRPIKVATWNVEHLAEQNDTGCRPRTDADYADLRRHVAALDADVIAIQEVENQAAAERVFDPDLYDVVMSGRPVSARGGACRGLVGKSIQQQAVGFAVRKGVPWTRNADVSDLALGNPDLRWGVDISVNGATPLRLLSVHLKSGCNSGRAATDPDCPVLFNQLAPLEKWIDDRAAAGEAFAVLGDWNRRISATNDQFYREINDGDPSGSNLTIAAGNAPATCKARYREFIDHIVTGTKASALVVPGSFAEYTYGVPEDRHPSDHCPVSVELKL